MPMDVNSSKMGIKVNRFFISCLQPKLRADGKRLTFLKLR